MFTMSFLLPPLDVIFSSKALSTHQLSKSLALASAGNPATSCMVALSQQTTRMFKSCAQKYCFLHSILSCWEGCMYSPGNSYHLLPTCLRKPAATVAEREGEITHPTAPWRWCKRGTIEKGSRPITTHTSDRLCCTFSEKSHCKFIISDWNWVDKRKVKKKPISSDFSITCRNWDSGALIKYVTPY